MSKQITFVANIGISIPVDAPVAYLVMFVKKLQAKLICTMAKHVWFEWSPVVYLLNTIQDVDREITRFYVNPSRVSRYMICLQGDFLLGHKHLIVEGPKYTS